MDAQTKILSFIKQNNPDIKEEWQIIPQNIYEYYKEKKISLDYACQYLKCLIENYHIVGINKAIESLQLYCFIGRKDKNLFLFLEELIITHIGTYNTKADILICIALFKLASLFPKKSKKTITYVMKKDIYILFELEYNFNYKHSNMMNFFLKR